VNFDSSTTRGGRKETNLKEVLKLWGMRRVHCYCQRKCSFSNMLQETIATSRRKEVEAAKQKQDQKEKSGWADDQRRADERLQGLSEISNEVPNWIRT
jgi:hypothetical protein